jgi:protein-S-isoprenylcysteine O-methyltransferase Ste14
VRWNIFGAILIIAAVALYGFLHSVLASSKAKTWAERSFGPQAGRYYRMFFNVLGILTFLPILAIPILLPGETLYQITGIGLMLSSFGQVAAIIILVLGVIQTDPWQFLGIRQLAHHSKDNKQQLIINGLYRCVRHPLYTAGLVFIWLIPYMTTTLLALDLSLTIYIYLGSIFEERRLMTEFGSAYVAYRGKVPRLIPNFVHCLFRRS